jgi:hypothetical protein
MSDESRETIHAQLVKPIRTRIDIRVQSEKRCNPMGNEGSPVCLFGNIPRRIRPDEAVDSRLAGFPVNLLYSQIADPETDRETAKLLLMMCAFDPAKLLGDKELCKKVRAVWYWPDPTSYIEDGHKRQMQYNSRKAGEYSITVIWDKDQSRWETRKYKGDELVSLAIGGDYNSAMRQTTLLGPQLDEALDTQ